MIFESVKSTDHKLHTAEVTGNSEDLMESMDLQSNRKPGDFIPTLLMEDSRTWLIRLAGHSALDKAGQVSCGQERGSHPTAPEPLLRPRDCRCPHRLWYLSVQETNSVGHWNLRRCLQALCWGTGALMCGHRRLVAPVIFVPVWSCWRALLSWPKAICFISGHLSLMSQDIKQQQRFAVMLS